MPSTFIHTNVTMSRVTWRGRALASRRTSSVSKLMVGCVLWWSRHIKAILADVDWNGVSGNSLPCSWELFNFVQSKFDQSHNWTQIVPFSPSTNGPVLVVLVNSELQTQHSKKTNISLVAVVLYNTKLNENNNNSNRDNENSRDRKLPWNLSRQQKRVFIIKKVWQRTTVAAPASASWTVEWNEMKNINFQLEPNRGDPVNWAIYTQKKR